MLLVLKDRVRVRQISDATLREEKWSKLHEECAAEEATGTVGMVSAATRRSPQNGFVRVDMDPPWSCQLWFKAKALEKVDEVAPRRGSPRRQRCGGDGCGNTDALTHCCRDAYYCCEDCQRWAWRHGHRDECTRKPQRRRYGGGEAKRRRTGSPPRRQRVETPPRRRRVVDTPPRRRDDKPPRRRRVDTPPRRQRDDTPPRRHRGRIRNVVRGDSDAESLPLAPEID
eukprot:TRINITY_DN30828_c0_g1_i1.p1 TRINITY_DN30828_c0_g1~~TRINITY_DN30828_c0_g1_i1.p1  ORF type:complete len:227 (+),score=55.23 TRINITY_DN30828_c0_g1_i1:55-735(+)